MGSSVNGLGVLSVFVALVAGLWLVAPAGASEPLMCPPTTIESLLEPEEPEETTTSTAAPETTSTTVPPTTPDEPKDADDAETPPATETTSETTVPESTSTTEPPAASASDTTTIPTTTTTSPTTTTTSPTTTTTSPTTTTTSPTTTTTSPTTTSSTEPECETPFVYPMTFPLLGEGTIGSPFGAPRDGGSRHHMGNDIAASTLQPIVAVADGTISRIAGDTGISGYRVHVRHDDGWSSLYIHLNNDTAGSDDGNGIGIRPDLAEGDRVAAGEVIGWNGDSGNAESTEPHLHFELRDPSGTPVDPRPSLQAAETAGPSFAGPFADLELDPDAPDSMALLLSRGVTVWCDAPHLACPDDPATHDDLSNWVNSLLGVELPECTETCDTVTESELAAALTWSRLTSWDRPVAQLDEITGDESHRLLGGTERCLNPPEGERPLARSQAADALTVYLGWSPVDGCPTNDWNR